LTVPGWKGGIGHDAILSYGRKWNQAITQVIPSGRGGEYYFFNVAGKDLYKRCRKKQVKLDIM